MQVARHRLAPTDIDYKCLWRSTLELLQHSRRRWNEWQWCGVCTFIISGSSHSPSKTRYFHVLIKGEMSMFNGVSCHAGCARLCMPSAPLWLLSWSVNGLTLLSPIPLLLFSPFSLSSATPVIHRDMRLSYYAHSTDLKTRGRKSDLL